MDISPAFIAGLVGLIATHIATFMFGRLHGQQEAEPIVHFLDDEKLHDVLKHTIRQNPKLDLIMQDVARIESVLKSYAPDTPVVNATENLIEDVADNKQS